MRGLLVIALLGLCAAVEWKDSPMLSDTWRAVSTDDFDTLLALTVSSSASFVQQRAADGRGAMWWAYEYRNPAALALFKHLSVSEEERDAVGLLPSDVYPDSAEELQELLADADERVAGIPAMLSQFVITLEQMRKEQAERFDEDLAPFEDADLDAGLDDEELDDELEEEEEEDSGPPAPEDIAARIAALKAKAQKMKDEM